MSKELKQAAEAYSKPFYEISECGENYTCTPQDAFKAGAKWMKEQLLDWAKQFTEPKIFVSTLIEKLEGRL